MIAFRKPRAPTPMALRPAAAISERPISQLAACAVMAFAIAAASLIDSPRALRAPGTTWLGIITLVETGLGAGALIFTRSLPKRVFALLSPYAAFMAWAALSTAWAPPRTQGLQNAAVFLSFLVLAAVAAIAATEYRRTVERLIQTAMLVADAIALGLVAASVIVRGWPTNIDAVPWFVHPRSLALFGLVPLSWHLAQWALGNERAIVLACLWVAAIFVSLSRTATAIALLLVLLAAIARAKSSQYGAPRMVRSQYLMFAVVPLVVVGVLSFAPFRARLTGSVARGASAQQFELRDNGRAAMWAGVMKSAAEAPIIGKGLGSSESAVSDTYFWVGHPHNDFLRIYHDLGVVGLILLVTSLGTWLVALWRDLRRPRDDIAAQQPVLQMAALGALISLMLGMLTDNPLVYGFVMAPTAVLLGAGLGARNRRLRRKRVPRASQPPEVSEEITSVPVSKPRSPELQVISERFTRRRRKRRRS